MISFVDPPTSRAMFSTMSLLPPLPGHRLEIREETSPPPNERGFLYVRRLDMIAQFGDGASSEPFVYFCVGRKALDAVVVVPHFLANDGSRHVVLRSALRPPLFARPTEIRAVPERASLGELWEVPAGLVEESEQSKEGIVRCAQRELFEETGYEVALDSVRELGPSTFPAPGIIGERHFFFHAVVEPSKRKTPPEDGSQLERAARIEAVPLELALLACRRGEIEDAKTELALRRLAEL